MDTFLFWYIPYLDTITPRIFEWIYYPLHNSTLFLPF